MRKRKNDFQYLIRLLKTFNMADVIHKIVIESVTFWSVIKIKKFCRFSFAMLTKFENCCFASFANPSEIWSTEARFYKKCLYRISLTSGLLTNRFGIKHLEFRVRGNIIGDFAVIWEHNVIRKLKTSLLNPSTWLVLTFPFFWRWLNSRTPTLSSISTERFCFAESLKSIFERRRHKFDCLKFLSTKKAKHNCAWFLR